MDTRIERWTLTGKVISGLMDGKTNAEMDGWCDVRAKGQMNR